MTRQAQISTAVSIILHVLALLIFAGVKLYTYKSIEVKLPITFLDEQKTRRLRRPPLIRPRMSLDSSPRRYSPELYAPQYRSSVEFYVAMPEKVFSEVRNVRQEVFRDNGILRPSVELRGHLSRPMATELLKEPHPRVPEMQVRISGGHDLLRDIRPAQAKPDVGIIDDILERFARTVRGKIESRKRYPISAQRAGIEGRTGVRMTILKDGQLGKVEVVEPSGYEILDNAALQSVRDAAPFPPIPEEVGRDEIEMSIHLVFEIT